MIEGLSLIVELIFSVFVHLFEILLTVFPWRFLLCLAAGLIAAFIARHFIRDSTTATIVFWTLTTACPVLGTVWAYCNRKH